MPTGGNNSTEIIIKLLMDTKDLTKGQSKLDGEMKKMKSKLTMSFGKQSKAAIHELTVAIKEFTEAVKKSAGVVATSEKKKQAEFKHTNTEIDAQKKKIEGLGKFAQSRTGKFLTAFAAGAGIGGLSKGLTAQGMGSFAGRMVSRGASSILGFAMSGFSQAYNTYVQYGQAQAGMIGLGNRRQMSAGARGAGRARGSRLGYSMIDTAGQAPGIARASGNLGAVYQAQQFARATGMDVGEVGGYMGMVRQAGYGFGGTTRAGAHTATGTGTTDTSGSKILEKVVAAGIYSGIERARLPEFMQGVAGITGAAGGKAAGRVDVTGIAAFQALLGSSGNAGFQGARGAAVGQQLMGATVAPGGGEAGQSMMLQALGFGKPGGQTSYYDALKSQQQGMQKPENVAAMFKEVYSQLGVAGAGGGGKNQQEANIALNEMTGLSLDQIEKLGDIFNSGKSAEEQMKAVKDQLQKSEPIEKQALRQMTDFGGTAVRIAGKTDTLIGIGAKTAPMFEKIEKWQLGALKWMADGFPAMTKWLEKIYILMLQLSEFFLKDDKKRLDDLMKNQDKTLAELNKKYKSGTLAEQAETSGRMVANTQLTRALGMAEAVRKIAAGVGGGVALKDILAGNTVQAYMKNAKEVMSIHKAGSAAAPAGGSWDYTPEQVRAMANAATAGLTEQQRATEARQMVVAQRSAAAVAFAQSVDPRLGGAKNLETKVKGFTDVIEGRADEATTRTVIETLKQIAKHTEPAPVAGKSRRKVKITGHAGE